MSKVIKDIDEEIDRILECLSPLEYHKPLDNFYASMEERLEHGAVPAKRRISTMYIAYAVIFLILFLNVILILNLIGENESAKKKDYYTKMIDGYSTIQKQNEIY